MFSSRGLGFGEGDSHHSELMQFTFGDYGNSGDFGNLFLIRAFPCKSAVIGLICVYLYVSVLISGEVCF